MCSLTTDDVSISYCLSALCVVLFIDLPTRWPVVVEFIFCKCLKIITNFLICLYVMLIRYFFCLKIVFSKSIVAMLPDASVLLQILIRSVGLIEYRQYIHQVIIKAR